MQAKNYMIRRVLAFVLGALSLSIFLLSAGAALILYTTPTLADASQITHEDARQLQSYQHWITLLKQSGGDVTHEQKQYDADYQLLKDTSDPTAHKEAQTRLQAHLAAIQLPALKTRATYLRQQLRQKVAQWGAQHQYHDSYDGLTYALGYEYGSDGADGLLEDDFNAAQSAADYQHVVDTLTMYLTNFDTMVANRSDTTPYDHPHQADQRLMTQYQVAGQKVLVVSLQEQAMRIYDQGSLVKALLVTTGRPNHPSLPGSWNIQMKLSPTTFKSGVPVGSPDYYPDTHINYAMQYHENGYFVHDSWWRNLYGPGTNFPHQDTSGDSAANLGSHGCVNVSLKDASWIYSFVELHTAIIIY